MPFDLPGKFFRGSTNSPPNRQPSEAEDYTEQWFPSDPEQTLNENNCSVVINCDYLQATGNIYDSDQIGALKKLIETQFGTNLLVEYPSYFKSGKWTYDNVAEYPITGIKFCYVEELV